MTTATLVRAIEEAVAHREGANLLTWATSSRVNLSATDPTILADVDLLKVGTFNGWSFTASDLEACVEHFASLTASGIFQPPVRLDHSWSILQVIGYIDAMRTAVDVDATTGQETTFLRGDLRITEPTALGLIKRGTAVNRSSELGPYETNSGVLYPLICYGVAFVDIPAVEGLRPIELSRRYGSPRTVISLDGGQTLSAIDPTAKCATCGHLASFHGTKGGKANAGPCSVNNCTCQAMKLSQEGATVTTSTDQAAGTPAAGDSQTGTPAAAGTGTPTETPAGGAGPQTGGSTTTAAPDGETEAQRELRELREERAELRREAAESSLSRFQERGVVIPANLEHARTLLSHEDKAVRDAAGGLLGTMSPPVELGARHGRQEGTGGQTSTAGGVTTAGDGSIDLSGKDPDEVGSWWAELDTAQRKAGTPEHAAMTKWRQDRAGARS